MLLVFGDATELDMTIRYGVQSACPRGPEKAGCGRIGYIFGARDSVINSFCVLKKPDGVPDELPIERCRCGFNNGGKVKPEEPGSEEDICVTGRRNWCER
jgi:hypothetical protein